VAIRIRRIDGFGLVALCAAEIDEMLGDLYLDDEAHYALAAKFADDWQGRIVNWRYEEEWAAMRTQKLRDARDELLKWLAALPTKG
jgi:hypothetical protein